MSTPSTDRAAIRRIIRALKAAGFPPYAVNDGGDELVMTSNEKEAIEAIMAVDTCTYIVSKDNGEHRHGVLFVLGNEPEDVAADWHMSIDAPIAAEIDSWQ